MDDARDPCHASATPWVPAPRAAPAGTVLFAVGDVHGHAAELRALLALLREQAETCRPARIVQVLLGDYVDRGPDSAAVLDELVAERARGDGIERVQLVGNHDHFLRLAAQGDEELDRPFFTAWFDNGGETTLRDLGVAGWGRLLDAHRFDEFAQRLRDALGPARRAALDALRPWHREGGYLFVHAGVDPSLPLESHDLADLLLMREPFLGARGGWSQPFTVVHGHSIEMPTVRPHRIGVDAGCYQHGALCAVQIAGERLRFLGVTREAGFDWNAQLPGRDGRWRWSDAGLVGAH